MKPSQEKSPIVIAAVKKPNGTFVLNWLQVVCAATLACVIGFMLSGS